MLKIKLTREQEVIIDNNIYIELSKFKWFAFPIIYKNKLNGYYAARNIKKGKIRRILFMHRLITNAPKGMDVDHINGVTLDNRLANLRVCTRSENQRNRHTSRKTNTSMFGVTKNKNSYQAQIVINRKTKYLGCYSTEQLASEIATNAYKSNLILTK